MQISDDVSEMITLLENRASVRDYDSKEVPEPLLERILNAACQAPTSSNVQAYSLVVVRSVEKRRSLAILAGGQKHVMMAPVMVAVCADLHRLSQVCLHNSKTIDSGLCELNLVAVIDATLVGMCASLVAESFGLGTVMIGGLRNDPEAVAQLLSLPTNVFCPFGLCFGWPASTPPAKPRLPTEAVVFQECYGEVYPHAAVQHYDQTLSQHHSEIGRDAGPPWSVRVTSLLSNPHRTDLAAVLKRLGFAFR